MRPGPSPFSLLRNARVERSRICKRHINLNLNPSKLKYDLPPPPPMSKRLRPLLPFFFWWCAITTLAVHRLRMRQQAEIDLGLVNAQISVLEQLIAKTRAGENLSDAEVLRELQMVGLRDRAQLSEEDDATRSLVKDVTWKEALLGRKRKLDPESEGAEPVVKTEAEEWTDVMKEVTADPKPAPAPQPVEPERRGMARRAPSASVYL